MLLPFISISKWITWLNSKHNLDNKYTFTHQDEPCGSHGPRQTQQKSALQFWFLHTIWLQPPSFSMVTLHFGHSWKSSNFTLIEILIMNKLWKLYWIRAPQQSFTEYGSRNSQTNFSEYMANALEMVYIASPCSHHWHLSIYPTVAQRLVLQHTRNQSVCRQELTACFLFVYAANHLPSKCFQRVLQICYSVGPIVPNRLVNGYNIWAGKL